VLTRDADAERFFDSLSYSKKLWFVIQVTDAKTPRRANGESAGRSSCSETDGRDSARTQGDAARPVAPRIGL
jgi:hypothetical protein